VILAFTWDWSSWYAAVVYAVGGLVVIGIFVRQIHDFWHWLRARRKVRWRVY